MDVQVTLVSLREHLHDWHERNVELLAETFGKDSATSPPTTPCPSTLEYPTGGGLRFLHCEKELAHAGLHKEGLRYWGTRAQEREERKMERAEIRRLKRRYRHHLRVWRWIHNLLLWAMLSFWISTDWLELTR